MAETALRLVPRPASAGLGQAVAGEWAAQAAGRSDARARCRAAARDYRLAKDHGFLSTAVALLVELAHPDARARRVAQVPRQQVLRQKVANSPGQRPPV
jgi:hypothetical protein